MASLRMIRSTLSTLAKQFSAVLTRDPRCVGLLPPLPRYRHPRNDSTKGYWVQTGRLGQRISMEFWLDHFSGMSTPRVWFGLSSLSAELLSRVLSRPPLIDFRKRLIRRSTRDVRRKPPYQFVNPLRSTEFDTLVHEHYPGDRHYLGVFSSYPWPFARYEKAAICRDATNLAAMFCAALSEGEPSAFEGLRTEVVTYKQGRSRTLRDSALAKSKGICEACSVDYSALLEGKGMRVLQVHHRKQLAATDRPRLTKLNELAVICANCHTLIHMNSKRALSVEKLRAMLRGTRA